MIRPSLSVFGRTVALCLLFAAVPLASPALGKPDWARPLLDAPSPSGAYIAKGDKWVVVHQEVEFSLDGGGKIVRRCRAILENMTDRPQEFSKILTYDEGRYTLSDVALNVQRKFIWHTINLKHESVNVSVSGQMGMLYTGVEDVPPHHRVAWEYTLTDKWGFLPWSVCTIPEDQPVAEETYTIRPDAARKGLRLRLVLPRDEQVPPCISQSEGGALTAKDVPAWDRMPHGLAFQPDSDALYPYVLASLTERGGWQAFARKVADAWQKNEDAMDIGRVKAEAEKLCSGLESPSDKARRLARFVQTKVLNDDSNEKGINAWMPLSTQETLRSRRGDCKGKVMLLEALLKSEGIESAPVVLRYSDRFFPWLDAVGTCSFNHVILAIHLPPRKEKYPSTLKGGPAAGWVLVDPTVQTADFGSALPGHEGLPALAVGREVCGPFIIHTHRPSQETAEISIRARLEASGRLSCKAEVRTNGGSPVVGAVAEKYTRDSMRKALLDELGTMGQGFDLVGFELKRPARTAKGETLLEVNLVIRDSCQDLSDSRLLANPLALAAIFMGLPNGLPRRAPIPPEDRVRLSPPWDARSNANGLARQMKVTLDLALPAGSILSAPSDRSLHRPWLALVSSWRKARGSRWKASVKMVEPRGIWARSERHDHLVEIDRIYAGFYAPLVLKQGG